MTNQKPDERNRNVNIWWNNALNPPSQMANEEAVDEYRFQTCYNFILAKGLASQLSYSGLIHSGTLRFVCKTNIDIRKKANSHAHNVDVSALKESMRKTMGDRNDLCTPADLICINGIIDFLNAEGISN